MSETETIKVVLLGESGVGKTSIISQFSENKFDPYCQSSLNSQFITKILEFSEYKKSLKFDIWDTLGQEKYRSLSKIFYRDADVIILVYDITYEYSFTSIKNFWYSEIKNNADKNPFLILVANKSDLYKNEKISLKEGKNYAKEINAIFVETSASSNIQINNLFENIGKKIIDPEYEINTNENHLNNIIYDKESKKRNELDNSENYKSKKHRQSVMLKKKDHETKKNKEKKKCCE